MSWNLSKTYLFGRFLGKTWQFFIAKRHSPLKTIFHMHVVEIVRLEHGVDGTDL